MKDRYLTALFLLYISYCQGLKLTLNRETPVPFGDRVPCGVLLCEEDTPPPATTSSPSAVNSNNAGHVFANIASMSIFKKAPSLYSADKDDHTNGALVVSLTPDHPNITRVQNGVKMNGGLGAQKSAMQLELFKQDDCRSEYTCQVIGVDNRGRELLSTTTLVREPQSRGVQGESSRGVMSEAGVLQVLSQQLGAQMALVTKSVENIEDKMGNKISSIERRLEDRLRSAEREFQDRIDSIENVSFERRLEDKLDSLENRIEDKIEHNVLEKLYQLDAKLSKFTHDNAKSESVSNLLEKLKTTKQEIENEIPKSFQHALDNMTALISKLEVNLSVLVEEKTNENKILTQSMVGNIVHLQNEFQESFEKLEFALIYNTSRNTPSELSDQFTQLNSTLTAHLESAIIDTLTPKRCTRGMVFVFPPERSFPHALIHPGGKSGQEASYLCDTTTDGGGWILLQRRTTGNVDFYSDWAAYKRGFGSLDDDFWLGNEKMHTLTSDGTWELRVDLRYKGKAAFAHYSTFSVADEEHKYTLTIGPYDGNAGDSLTPHNGKPFSTFDRDNDDDLAANCAVSQTGGWWYHHCDHANLNGAWNGGPDLGLEWHALAGSESASFSEMKIRRVV